MAGFSHNFNLPHGTDDADDLSEDGDQVLFDFETGGLVSDDEASSPKPMPEFKATAQITQPNKGKKSPRRVEDEDSDEASGRKKKGRPSLFGNGEDASASWSFDSVAPESSSKKKVRPSLFGNGGNDSTLASPSNDDNAPEDGDRKNKKAGLSLLGSRPGPFDYSDSEDDADDERASEAPTGIGGRMSSLTLDHTKDNDQRSSKQSHTPLATVNEPDRTPSPTPSEELDDEELSIPEDPVISYGLRKNIDRKRVTTFIDEDRTGDFDPAEEARKEAQKRIESKARKQSKAKGKGKGKGKQKAVEVPKEFVRKLIVRLKFEAFGNVLNVTNSTDNWPDGHSILDTEDEHEQEERRTYFRQSTPGREPQIPVKDPYGELDDLTGYPEARGCKCCRQHLQHCSAIETGEFPCAQCTADDVDCHPLIEPKVKGRCKQCIERGTEACSYETEDCQGVQCDECFEDDIICEAGLPPSRYTVNRADIDRVMRGPDRKWVDCTNCRMLKKRCSIKKKSDKGPCKGCKKEKVPCTFYSTPIFELSRKKQGKKKVVENGESSNTAATSTGYLNIKDIAPDVHMPDSTFFSPSDLEDLEKASSDDDNGNDDDTAMRDPSPEIELEDAEGRKGTMREIRTSFAHPIKFCTGTVDDYVPDCNFCEMPAYSFVGSFERTPLVIPWPNGAGFTEIAGGHRETGDGATTMCQTCTFARLQILACEAHDVHPMPSLIPASDDFDTAAEELISAEPRSRAFQEQLLRWCSMCFSPATHGCCATQPSILGGEDDEMMEGCGLRLCGRCEKEFREVFVGDSSAMATAFDREKKAREGDEEALKVVRADVGFLKSDGLLMRSVEG